MQIIVRLRLFFGIKGEFLFALLFVDSSKYSCLCIQHSSRHWTRAQIISPQSNLKFVSALFIFQIFKDKFVSSINLTMGQIWHYRLYNLSSISVGFFNLTVLLRR